MKRIVIIFLISGLSMAAGAQTQKQPAKAEPAKTPTTQPAKQAVSPLTEHFYKKYITALQWSDYEVAKDALYDLIIENPAE
jgi:hypothetical protein